MLNILEHKRQMEQLESAIGAGKIANAYLFHGQNGVGKMLVAKAFAAILACVSSTKPCGECIGCKKVENKTHPDVLFREPTGEKLLTISIDDIRSLNRDIQFHPMEMKNKVAIIRDAEMMTQAAQNSLLKLLEEPPANTHLILVTGSLGAILPTIRSRCQKIAFSSISEAAIVGKLMEMDIEEVQALKIARIAEGSLGVATKLSVDLIDGVVEKFLTIALGGSSADVLALAEEWSNAEEAPSLICDILISLYRDATKRLSSLDGYRPIYTNSLSISMDEGLSIIEKLIGVRELLMNSTVNKRLIFESLLFSLPSAKL
ncbi:MAG: DNA polymerase III subunit delta' [Pseudomonadota bacterium]